jgi:hypothetical protein
MKIQSVGRYTIYQPTSGGKAGKHQNVTCGLQLRDASQTIIKQARYFTLDEESRERALGKLLAYAKAHP